MFNEQQIKYFVSLGNNLSFSHTAIEHSVSRQTVSKSIASLEKRLGLRLLERDKQNVSLTKAGKLVFEFCTDYSMRYDALKERLCGIDSASSDCIVIGFQEYLSIDAEIFLPAHYDQRDHEKVVIEVTRYSPKLLLNRLLNRQMDIVVMFKRLACKLDSLESCELQKMPLQLLVSAQNPKVSPGAEAADFVEEPLIICRLEGESNAELKNRIAGDIELCGLRPSKIIEVTNKESADMAIRTRKGIWISTPSSHYIYTKEVAAYDTGAFDSALCLWRNHNNPATAEYIKHIIGRLS